MGLGIACMLGDSECVAVSIAVFVYVNIDLLVYCVGKIVLQSNHFNSYFFFFTGRSIMTKKGEGSQVKESTDSTNTTLEDNDVKGK